MFRKIIVGIFAIIGISLGFSVGPLIWKNFNIFPPLAQFPVIDSLLFGLIFIILGWVLSPYIENFIKRFIRYIENQSTAHILFGLLGLVLGLLLGYLLSLPFSNIPILSSIAPLVFCFLGSVIGYHIMMNRREELLGIFSNRMNKMAVSTLRHNVEKVDDPIIHVDSTENLAKDKLLDTSAIIDGRMAEIVKTGFIEGRLVVPHFVLIELQHIADSSDALKRSKGRRGLDILNRLQKEGHIEVRFFEGDVENVSEVDAKLVVLAKKIGGVLVTTDYNLNKVAEFQQVAVLNINDLANALKPAYVPGEEMHVQIIKAGTERRQGVAYLDDGTMVVVEEGLNHINEWLDVVVTSFLQTSAGRMIFGKIKESETNLKA
ncbi:PIN/TRAM domain-containing protein [Facklamia hominis]|uniref:PIN/TRAM domain-containing protein n=1 Tax=Facklamia hominis TaxID=178214 RepID=UPI000C7DF555|nr:PIN domain-containing protein [Facklamia hominis]PKY93911.1 PIN domain nuclease [Facklamia hominis]